MTQVKRKTTRNFPRHLGERYRIREHMGTEDMRGRLRRLEHPYKGLAATALVSD